MKLFKKSRKRNEEKGQLKNQKEQTEIIRKTEVKEIRKPAETGVEEIRKPAETEVEEIRNPNETEAEPELFLGTIKELKLADQCFLNNDFEEALKIYEKALSIAKERDVGFDPLFGDIHVKISTIHQGKGRLELAIEHLNKAKEIQRKVINEGNNSEVSQSRSLKLKLIEVVTTVANIYVDMDQMNKAYDTYKEVIKISREYLSENDPYLGTTLSNYANFMSMCMSDHDEAIEIFKEVLKIQHATSKGKIVPQTAGTLNYMGKVYMRKSKLSNGIEGRKDAKRAEVCFVRALQLYRLSMIRNGNDKVAETLYNLSDAREWQKQRKGILRNVRFDATTIPTQHTTLTEDDHSILTYETYETYETVEEDLEKYSKNASLLFNGERGSKNKKESFWTGCLGLIHSFDSDSSSEGSSILIDEKDMKDELGRLKK